MHENVALPDLRSALEPLPIPECAKQGGRPLFTKERLELFVAKGFGIMSGHKELNRW